MFTSDGRGLRGTVLHGTHSFSFDEARAAQAQRIQAVIDCGFTERQARFLVLVMRHAGVCVPRQYASFAGIAHGGRRCHVFFDKLVRCGYAHEIRCVHNRARVFHVHHKPLYFLIGEVTSRYRRSLSPRLAVERLMRLDAILMMPNIEWLATASEKAGYLARLRADVSVDASQTPSMDDGSATPLKLSSAFPIGLERDGRAVLLYLPTEPSTEPFRSFLQAHATLLRVAPTWTLRLVFPRPLDRAYDAYQAVIHEELESPLHSATIGELKSYFEDRLKAARGEPLHPQTQSFLNLGAKVFGTPRFTAMYQRWLRHGNAVFEGPSSPAIAAALNSGCGRVESVVLPHVYRHLAPLVADAPSRPEPMTRGLRRGLRRGHRRGNIAPRALNPRPQPPPEEPPLSITEQMDLEWRRLVEWDKAQKALEVRP
ncbi:MAG: hypothetical protein GEU99_12670 [Luteitalea sp.]|nr:hypothetical protein [Luteitalea sp.]